MRLKCPVVRRKNPQRIWFFINSYWMTIIAPKSNQSISQLTQCWLGDHINLGSDSSKRSWLRKNRKDIKTIPKFNCQRIATKRVDRNRRPVLERQKWSKKKSNISDTWMPNPQWSKSNWRCEGKPPLPRFDAALQPIRVGQFHNQTDQR